MEDDYKEFRKNILKVSLSRNHNITNSIGVYDIYKYIRKNKWFNIERPLKELEFYTIIRAVNKAIASNIASGNSFIIPYRLGEIELRKDIRRVKYINGKIKSNLPIDYESTLKLWYEDPISKENKILLKRDILEIFKIYWNKRKALFTNKTLFEFKPNRELKKKLSNNCLKNKVDAYLYKVIE